MAVVGLPSHVPSVASRTSKITIATVLSLSLILIAHYSGWAQQWESVGNPLAGIHSAQFITGSPTGVHFLPLEIAQEKCSHRRLDVYSNRNGTRKVYDIFIINTELDMLELRLEELHEQVDYFVVVESRTTFVGDEKPLYLRENWDRFQPFHHQIIYKELDLTGLDFQDPWARERHHRDSMYSQVVPFLEGKQKANLDDVLIVSVSIDFFFYLFRRHRFNVSSMKDVDIISGY